MVTLRVDNLSWEDVLTLAAESAGCVVEREGNVWRVSKPARVTIEEENGDFRKIVAKIADAAGANVIVGIDVPEDLKVSVRFRGVRWDRALEAVVKSVGMALVRYDRHLGAATRAMVMAGGRVRFVLADEAFVPRMLSAEELAAREAERRLTTLRMEITSLELKLLTEKDRVPENTARLETLKAKFDESFKAIHEKKPAPKGPEAPAPSKKE